MSFSLKEGLERVYESKPATKMEKLIKRSREYCRSCKTFKELVRCLNLTKLEESEIKSTSTLNEDDIALIMTGYHPSMTDNLVIDSEELKRILSIKPEKIHSKEIMREFYKLRIKYLAAALDEAVIMARQFAP